MMILKLAILSVVLIGLVFCDPLEDDDVVDREMGDYEPIPISDSDLKAAFKAIKPKLVAKVFKLYPNITEDPRLGINSAEGKKPLDFKLPKVIKYRANITLYALMHGSYFSPVLTFNVTLVSSTYRAGDAPRYTHLRFFNLTGLNHPKKHATGSFYLPNQRRPWAPWVDVPLNDTGLLAAVDALQQIAWRYIYRTVEIERIPGSYVRNDFVITEAHFRAPKDETYKNFDLEYEAIISLGLAYPTPTDFQYSFKINIYATYYANPGSLGYMLGDFKSIGFYSGIKRDTLQREEQFPPQAAAEVLPQLPFKDVTASLKNVLTDLKGVFSDLKDDKDQKKPELQINDLLPLPLAKEERVDFTSLIMLLKKLNTTIISTVNFVNHLNGSDVVVPPGSGVFSDKVVQKTIQLPMRVNPPYFLRTYNLTNALIIAEDPFKIVARNLFFVFTEFRQADPDAHKGVRAFNQKLVQFNNYVLPDKVPYDDQQKLPIQVEQKSDVDLYL